MVRATYTTKRPETIAGTSGFEGRRQAVADFPWLTIGSYKSPVFDHGNSGTRYTYSLRSGLVTGALQIVSSSSEVHGRLSVREKVVGMNRHAQANFGVYT